MKFFIAFIICFFAAHLTGCSSSDNASMESPGINTSAIAAQRTTTPYLAYEHNLSNKLSSKELPIKYKNLINYCSEDRENNCTILKSELSSGNYAYGKITLRIAPEGVKPLLELASDGTEITNESTVVEDLSTHIFDTEKRIKMLESYQSTLFELQKKAGENIESLIKVSQELASVQSQLEEAQGNNATLLQRVNMDIVNIRLSSHSRGSFWQPIGDAADEFLENLSEGIANTITAVAFLLPWILLLTTLFFTIRFIWNRKRRAKK